MFMSKRKVQEDICYTFFSVRQYVKKCEKRLILSSQRYNFFFIKSYMHHFLSLSLSLS